MWFSLVLILVAGNFWISAGICVIFYEFDPSLSNSKSHHLNTSNLWRNFKNLCANTRCLPMTIFTGIVFSKCKLN